MINKKLCIVNSKILNEIFSELSENLSFEVFFKKSKELDQNDFESKNAIYIIDEKEIELISLFKFDQILVLEKIPYKINDLINQINIKFLKVNFHNQSNIKIKDYNLDINSKFISKKNKLLKLTEKEIQIIIFLYSNSKAISIKELQKNIWHHHEDLETHTVETHVYRLRKKIRDKFEDNDFILNSNLGYEL